MKFTKVFKWILAVLSCFSIAIFINNEIITSSTKDMIFKEIKDIPQSDICLLLGTPKYLPDRSMNIYYQYRIRSAVDLYTNHKVNKILISADTLNKYLENEVELIINDLLQNGIRDTDLICDRKGNNTRNSILNLRNFNGRKIIIVSQNFHLGRALYLAKRLNLNVLGYISGGVPTNKLKIRELFARFKMQTDLILN